jgi:hypothetical protein
LKEEIMRVLVFAALVSSVLLAPAMAEEPRSYDAAALPKDEASLRDLDNAQMRIVRRAGAQCAHSGEGGFGGYRNSPRGRACIIGLVESAVKSSENPALVAYHNWLPFPARYDEMRVAYWQKLVES